MRFVPRRPAIVLRAAFILIALAPSNSGAVADFPIRSSAPPVFVADALTSPAGPDSSRVEILWEIPREALAFRGEGDDCRAAYDLSIVFFQGERQVTGDIWSKRVRCRDLPTSSGAAARGREVFRLARGNYEAEVTLTIPATRLRSSARGRLKLESGGSAIEASDLELFRVTESGVVPNPRHEIARGELGHRARIRLLAGVPAPAGIRLRWGIFDGRRTRVVGGDSTVAGEPETLVELALPVEQLEPGSYRLEVEVLDGKGDSVARRRADLLVRITMEWLAANRREAALLLEILGAGDEASALRKAGGEEWTRVLQEYWDSRDPTPGTPANEARAEVFARMESANAAFDEPLRKPGWTTDRGRIFLRYGRPENRVVREADFNGPGAEIWEYFQPRRTFVFLDDRGIGEYVLSTGHR